MGKLVPRKSSRLDRRLVRPQNLIGTANVFQYDLQKVPRSCFEVNVEPFRRFGISRLSQAGRSQVSKTEIHCLLPAVCFTINLIPFHSQEMWLINRETCALEYYHDPPEYLILSHTWGDEEVTFQEIKDLNNARKMKGFRKIEGICNVPLYHQVRHVWVDTCCIDKSSSAELTESINSMFRWYRQAICCVIYLDDLEPATNTANLPAPLATEEDLGPCRWFSRGWTLQELVAPYSACFYDVGWTFRGSKQDLVDALSNITKIDKTTLLDADNLSNVLIGRRMSWAADRNTTRIEDQAYSLLGIFGVNMPLIYGEREKAFTRLQQAIVQNHPDDLSIFAWSFVSARQDRFTNLFASEPSLFRLCSSLQRVRDSTIPSPNIVVTNKVVEILTSPATALLSFGGQATSRRAELLLLNCHDSTLGNQVAAIPLRRAGPVFARDGKNDLVLLDPLALRFQKLARIRILQEAVAPCPRHGRVDSTARLWRFFHSFEIHDPRVYRNLSADVTCYPQHQLNQDPSLRLTTWEFSIPGKDEDFTTLMEVRFCERSNTPYSQPSYSPETTLLAMCGLTEPTGGRDVKHTDFWLAIIRQHGDTKGLFPEFYELESGSYNPYTLSVFGQRLRAMYSTDPHSDVFARECEIDVNGYGLKISADVRRWEPKSKHRDEVESQFFVGLEVRVQMSDLDLIHGSEVDGEKDRPRRSQLKEYLEDLV